MRRDEDRGKEVRREEGRSDKGGGQERSEEGKGEIEKGGGEERAEGVRMRL